MAKCECCERFLAAQLHMEAIEVVVFPSESKENFQDQSHTTHHR